jgi:glycerol uptake facilitator-like aquaporin
LLSHQKAVLKLISSTEDGVVVPIRLKVKNYLIDLTSGEPKAKDLEAKKATDVLVRAVLGEFLCTYLFLLIVEAIVINSSRAGQKDALIGAVGTAFSSIALIYSFADVSGAHFNPSVTFATMVTRKTGVVKGLMYIMAQLIGSILATATLTILFPIRNKPIPESLVVKMSYQSQYGFAFATEFILTFILIYVIFSTAFNNCIHFLKFKSVSGSNSE